MIIITVAVIVLLIVGAFLIHYFCCKTDSSEERRVRIRDRMDRIDEAKSRMETRSGGTGFDEEGGSGVGPRGRSGLSWDGNWDDGSKAKSRIEYDFDPYGGYNGESKYKKPGRSTYGGSGYGRNGAGTVVSSGTGSGYDVDSGNEDADKVIISYDEEIQSRKRRQRKKRRHGSDSPPKGGQTVPNIPRTSYNSNPIDSGPGYIPPLSGSHSIVLFRPPSTDTFPAAQNQEIKSKISDHLSQLRYKSPTEKSRTEKSRTEKSRTEKPRMEKSRTEKPRTEKSRTEKSRTEKSRISYHNFEDAPPPPPARKKPKSPLGSDIDAIPSRVEKSRSPGSSRKSDLKSVLADPSLKEYRVKTTMKEFKISRDDKDKRKKRKEATKEILSLT